MTTPLNPLKQKLNLSPFITVRSNAGYDSCMKRYNVNFAVFTDVCVTLMMMFAVLERSKSHLNPFSRNLNKIVCTYFSEIKNNTYSQGKLSIAYRSLIGERMFGQHFLSINYVAARTENSAQPVNLRILSFAADKDHLLLAISHSLFANV